MGEKKFTDIELITALDHHKGNVTRVAEALGVSRAAVIKRKKKIPEGIITPDVETFRQERANIFASIQQALLRYITPDKLKGASLAQIGTLFGIMYDKGEGVTKSVAMAEQEMKTIVLFFDKGSWVDVRDVSNKRLIYRAVSRLCDNSLYSIDPG